MLDMLDCPVSGEICTVGRMRIAATGATALFTRMSMRDPVVESQLAHQIGHSSIVWVNVTGTARGSRVGLDVDIASTISAT